MKFPEFNDLYNPENITSFLHTTKGHIVLADNQAFQAYYNAKYPNGKPKLTSLEIWEKLPDGRLLRVTFFKATSIIATY